MAAAEQHEGYDPVPTRAADSLELIADDSALGRELTKITTEPKNYSSLPSDTWGVALFAVVNDLPDIVAREASSAQAVRFTFAMIVLFANIVMQISILHWVGLYVVGTSVRTMQEQYMTYHATSFDQDGTFNQGDWESNDQLRSELCDSALSQFSFLFFICFLWAARILVEIRSTLQLDAKIRAIHDLPSGAPNANMVLEVEREGEKRYDIVCLSRGARSALYVLVLIPKFLIAMYLFYIGVKWLASTESFKDLILNALGLEFVLGIDELFFVSFFPEEELITVVAAHWAPPKKERNAEEINSDTIRLYTRSLFYIVCASLSVYVYLAHLQDVLPRYHWDISHCHTYVAEFLSPLCRPGSSGAECFPFGA